MDFLNHSEEGLGLYQFLLLSPLQCTVTVRGCASLKKYTSQCKAVEVTVNNKEENSSDFFLDFVLEFDLCTKNEGPLEHTVTLTLTKSQKCTFFNLETKLHTVHIR
jgi:hypothetical protein